MTIPEGVCPECLGTRKIEIPCIRCVEIPETSTHWDRALNSDYDPLEDEPQRLEAEDQRHADIGQGPDWNRE